MEDNRKDYVRVLRKNGQNLLECGATVADGPNYDPGCLDRQPGPVL